MAAARDPRLRAMLDTLSLILWRGGDDQPVAPAAPSVAAVQAAAMVERDPQRRTMLQALLLVRCEAEGRPVMPLASAERDSRPAFDIALENRVYAAPVWEGYRMEGHRARAAGRPETDCPYDISTVAGWHWREGWSGFLAGR